MYRHQGRKQKKLIVRYCCYDLSGLYTTMEEVALYEHSVAYRRLYLYHGDFTLVRYKRISMKEFREFENDASFNLFN